MGLFDGLKLDKLAESAQAGVKALQENVAKINVDEIVKSAKDAAETGMAMVGKAVSDLTGNKEDETEETKDLISLFWCLAHIDGAFSAEEREKLASMATSLDESYPTYADELERQLSARLESNIQEFGVQSAAKFEAQKILGGMELTPRDAKLLVWNLLAVATADGMEARELDFIAFVAKKVQLEANVMFELKNYSDALVELGRARDELKASSRPYAQIEPLVAELSIREQAIIQAAQSLVTDR